MKPEKSNVFFLSDETRTLRPQQSKTSMCVFFFFLLAVIYVFLENETKISLNVYWKNKNNCIYSPCRDRKSALRNTVTKTDGTTQSRLSRELGRTFPIKNHFYRLVKKCELKKLKWKTILNVFNNGLKTS